MFNKTRKKIVLAILSMTILFLLMTLTAIYLTSCLSLQKQSEEMLERYVSIYSPDEEQAENIPEDLPSELPGNLPETSPPGEQSRPGDGTLYLQSSFYSAAFAEDGGIISVDTGWSASLSKEEVTTFARSILEKGRSKGRYDHVLYRVEQKEDYTLVVFMDALLMEESMRDILMHTLLVGGIAVILFLAVSVILAGRIIRPLEENDRRQRQFVSDAGHELKTPVTVISTNAEILSREIGENRWLANIQYENERMGNLVRELLMLSHTEDEAFITEIIDFSELVEKEILPFESVAFEHGLSLASRIEGDVVVRGNRSQLGQLVSIFADNAITYCEGGGEVNVSLRKFHRSAVLEVENAGTIAEADRKRLFDRFYRGDVSRTGAEGHFGLGLSIAKSITEAHHGQISADCEEGKVVFRVVLPAE